MVGLRATAAVVLALAAHVRGLRLADEADGNATDASDSAEPRSTAKIVRGGPVKWTYFPPEPRLGIAVGGDPEEFAMGEYGSRNALILLQYAKRKGYALYVDKNVGRHTARKPGWAKLHVLHQLIDDVPLLVWMDPDVVMTKPDFSLETLIKQSPCRGVHQTRWDEYLSKEVKDDTFLWLSASDREGGRDQYEVNTAPGMMVLRRSPLAKEFLEKVWHVGGKPGYFLRHRYAARPYEAQVEEWPREQGAIWDVLASMPDKYLRKACIPAAGHLLSLDNHHWKEKILMRRLSDKAPRERNGIIGTYFKQFGLSDSML